MKEKTINRRHIVRIVSFSVAAFLALGGLTLKLRNEQKRLERYMEASYQHSFAELVDGMSVLEHALQKELYAVSPTLVSQLSHEVARASASAQSMMAQLPFSFAELEETAQFLSQTGDWSATLARSTASGQEISEEQRQTLARLEGSARSLAERLVELQTIINEENLNIGTVLKAEENLEEGEVGLFGDTFKAFADELSGLPGLVYDGPFSSHLENKESKLLENEQEISEDDALRIALDFTGLPEGNLTLQYEREGYIPSYAFGGQADGGEVSVEVTRKGGRVVTMVISAVTDGEETLSIEDAIQEAGKFLQGKGFTDMEHSYYQKTGNSLLVNFLYVENGVACYPDLCKVGISLDTGRITRFEATNYIMNHSSPRNIEEAAISAEEAKESAVFGKMELENTREALIPSPRGELHCHELLCKTGEGTRILIYVNAQTGVEEKILVLLENDGGTLAI